MNQLELAESIATMLRQSRYDAAATQEHMAKSLGVSKKQYKTGKMACQHLHLPQPLTGLTSWACLHYPIA